MWVAGADGCPSRWVVVFRSMAGNPPRARLCESIDDVFASPERPTLVAVDIPIGLPATSEPGGRTADRDARKLLGRKRQSSVFPTPSRAVLAATSFAQACEIERRNSVPPKKISQQAFNLLGKIRKVDALVRRGAYSIFECHPEVSFWAMNNRVAMTHSKKKLCGLEGRRRLLLRNGFPESILTKRLGSYRDHSWDDLLDACAAAWTAERIAKGHAVRVPQVVERDDLGVEMAIWA
jgi:predicted RNase H-like nuclease